MTQITVTDELARQITGASLPIVLVDGEGRRLGQIDQLTPDPSPLSSLSHEDWVEIKRRAENPGTYYTLPEIKERLGWADGQ